MTRVWLSTWEWACCGDPFAVGDDVVRRFAAAATVTTSEADSARATVQVAATQIRGLLVDAVLLLPTTSGGAIDRTADSATIDAHRGQTLRLTFLASLAGATAVTIPSLHDEHFRPVGLSVVGAPGTDLAVLDLAAELMRS